MTDPVIFHGTPLTPRAALQNIMPGRAGCVSFYRPDDLEALLAVCPQLMFRSRRLFVLDGSDARGSRVGPGQSGAMVARILRVVRTYHLPPRPVRIDTRQPGSTVANQRRPAERLAVRRFGRSGVPHGRAGLSTCEALRALSARGAGMDWTSEARARWVPCVSPEDGRDRSLDGQRMASAAHAPRNCRGMGLSVHQRRRDDTRAERMAL